MAGNVIYRGPVSKEPETVNLPVAGAYLPGSFVTSDGSTLTVATTGLGNKLFLLSNMRFKDQDAETAYASGDTGIAYDVQPGERYQARFANATYNKGDPLTVGASGRLEAATTGDLVVAWYDGVDGATLTAGALADVIIANAYVVPA